MRGLGPAISGPLLIEWIERVYRENAKEEFS
jgi:hypothetical protein